MHACAYSCVWAHVNEWKIACPCVLIPMESKMCHWTFLTKILNPVFEKGHLP